MLNEFQKYTNDIKSYVVSFHSNVQERKDFSINFFNRNKKNHKVYQTLIQIYENIDEDYEIRFQTMTILKKIFNKKDFDSYIQVKKVIIEDDIYYEKRDDLMLNEDLKNHNQTENYFKFMLPISNEKNQLSIEEENELFSHFSKQNNEKSFVKISLIDALLYIDQDDSHSKLREQSKKLVRDEMKKLPDLEAYCNMVNKHFEKISSFPKKIQKENNDNNIDMDIFNDTENHLKLLQKDFEMKNLNEENKKNLLESVINISNVFLEPLPHKLNDEDNWKNLLNDANISLQGFNSYNFNLDLYTKYGPLVWKKYTDNFEKLVNILKQEKADLDKNIELLNKDRKFSQVKFFY
jgi:hypothetical protein